MPPTIKLGLLKTRGRLQLALLLLMRSVRTHCLPHHSTTDQRRCEGLDGAARTMAKKMVSDQGRERTGKTRTLVYWPVGAALAR